LESEFGEWLIAQYALAKIGAIMVNINPAYGLRELEHALTQSGVSVIVAARGFRNSDFGAMLDELAPRLPALKKTVYLGKQRRGSTMTWDDLIEKAGPCPVGNCGNVRLRCDPAIRSTFNTLQARQARQRVRP
jgi:acyl-CoA synthetase (AMP-forming)/AMP-acid ligase II